MTNDQVLANYHAATDSALVRMEIEIADKLFSVVSTEYLKVGGAERLIGPDKLAQLTRENILTVNPSTRLVTFNSRHVQTFFTETGVFLSLVCCRPLLAHMKQLCLFAHEHAHCHVRNRRDSLGTRCLLGTTSLTNLVLTRTCWRPFRVNMSGLFLINYLGSGLSLRAC